MRLGCFTLRYWVVWVYLGLIVLSGCIFDEVVCGVLCVIDGFLLLMFWFGFGFCALICSLSVYLAGVCWFYLGGWVFVYVLLFVY